MDRWELYVKFKGDIKYELIDTFKSLTTCITHISELKDRKTGILKLLDKSNNKAVYF